MSVRYTIELSLFPQTNVMRFNKQCRTLAVGFRWCHQLLGTGGGKWLSIDHIYWPRSIRFRNLTIYIVQRQLQQYPLYVYSPEQQQMEQHFFVFLLIFDYIGVVLHLICALDELANCNKDTTIQFYDGIICTTNTKIHDLGIYAIINCLLLQYSILFYSDAETVSQ